MTDDVITCIFVVKLDGPTSTPFAVITSGRRMLAQFAEAEDARDFGTKKAVKYSVPVQIMHSAR